MIFNSFSFNWNKKKKSNNKFSLNEEKLKQTLINCSKCEKIRNKKNSQINEIIKVENNKLNKFGDKEIKTGRVWLRGFEIQAYNIKKEEIGNLYLEKNNIKYYLYNDPEYRTMWCSCKKHYKKLNKLKQICNLILNLNKSTKK